MQAHRVAFVGLGAIGRYMARNLARHMRSSGLPPLTVYNRTKSKCEELQAEVGAESVIIAESLGEVAKSCDVILTSLSNDNAVKAVYTEFKQALIDSPIEGQKIFVETSTNYPAFLEDLETSLSDIPNTKLIACPVFGAPPAADKAQLVIVMAGDPRVKAELTKLLVPAMGRKVVDVGGSIRKAPSLKLIGNSVVLGCIEVISEAITLGDKAGIDAHTVVGVLKDLFPNTPIASYGEMIANDAFDGSKNFTIDNGLKDAGHIRTLATELNSPMPVIDIAHQHTLTARALHIKQKSEGTQKFDVLSWSALVAGSRVAAGLHGLNSAEDLKVEKEE